MRKLFMILFAALLSLQWTAAAVAALCLPDARVTRPVQAHAQLEGADHAHDHGFAVASEPVGHHHGAHDHDPDSRAVHADHGCCHVTASVLPTRPAIGRMQAALGDWVSRMTVLAVSHSSESPFRPPRLALA